MKWEDKISMKKIKMYLPPIGYFQSDSWGDFTNKLNHPQFEVLKKHIDRAVQDLFLNSLRFSLVHLWVCELFPTRNLWQEIKVPNITVFKLQ